MNREEVENFIESYENEYGSGEDLFVKKTPESTIYSWSGNEKGEPDMDFLITDVAISDCQCPIEVTVNLKNDWLVKKFVEEVIFSESYCIDDFKAD